MHQLCGTMRIIGQKKQDVMMRIKLIHVYHNFANITCKCTMFAPG